MFTARVMGFVMDLSGATRARPCWLIWAALHFGRHRLRRGLVQIPTLEAEGLMLRRDVLKALAALAAVPAAALAEDAPLRTGTCPV